MNLNLYSVYDTCAGIYLQIFTKASDGEAVRDWGDICMDAESIIAKHPEHYSLYRVGVWNNASGKITPENPECLETAHAAIARVQKIINPMTEIPDNPGGSE